MQIQGATRRWWATTLTSWRWDLGTAIGRVVKERDKLQAWQGVHAHRWCRTFERPHFYVSSLANPTGSPCCCPLRDLRFQEIKSYAETYASRNYVVRVLTIGSDTETYDGLAARMRDLGEQLDRLLGLDSNARLQALGGQLQALQGAVDESRALLASVAKHQVGARV